ITISTTFSQSKTNCPIGLHKYTRTSNPNRQGRPQSENIEKGIACLQKAKHALAFSSRKFAMAVILPNLGHGSHVISFADVCGGAYRYFTRVATAHNVRVTFVKNMEQAWSLSSNPKKKPR
ncbi:hypothetical protein B0J13DRAFT_432446, partial [Dactylonectria estremocensis]